MPGNLTTISAASSMAALDGPFYMGIGRGINSTTLQLEISGAGYSRQLVNFSPTVNQATNTADISFTFSGSLSGTYGYFGLFTAASGGNAVWVGALSTLITVEPGTVVFRTGDIDLEIGVAL